MVVDAMIAHSLSMNGFKADVFESTSSRNTDKNLMIRAKKGKPERVYLPPLFNWQ